MVNNQLICSEILVKMVRMGSSLIGLGLSFVIVGAG
jgi:hypothetical protein